MVALLITEAATADVLWKRVFFKISHSSQENTCVRVSFRESCKPQAWKLMKKKTSTFSFEFLEIFQNTYFVEHLLKAASVLHEQIYLKFQIRKFPIQSDANCTF